MVAIVPDFWLWLPALCSIDCSASPLLLPISPLNWPMIAACAASRPNTSPAIEITISSNGAIEKIVKYAIAAARLKASSAMKPETVSLTKSRVLANIFAPAACCCIFSEKQAGRGVRSSVAPD